MTAALGLGGFALFGWLTGIVFRRFFRGRRFGFLSYLLLRFLLGAVAIFGLMLSFAVFSVGPDEVPSDLERAVLKIAAWPVFAVVAAWAYWHKVRTKIIRQRIVSAPGGGVAQPPNSGGQATRASGQPPAPPAPPAPLPQPF